MTGLANTPLGVELLDDPAAHPDIVRSSLRHIARSNRWLGGTHAARFGLARALKGLSPVRPLTLMDIGTGAGDLPLDARRWGARHGYRITPLGLDHSGVAARIAAKNGVFSVVGCAGSLPFGNQSVDIVLVSQVIHHMRRDAVVRMLRECDRIARRAVIVSDLHRARMAMAGFWVASRVLQFDATTQCDGITSVRRGYKLKEFAALFAEAGIAARCWRRPGYRLVAVWKRS